VQQAMAQFVLKIEKLSHIMGTAPIVESARAYDKVKKNYLDEVDTLDDVEIDDEVDSELEVETLRGKTCDY